MVKQAWEYRWSSAAAHMRGEDDTLVQVRPMLERVRDWGEYIGQGLPDSETRAIRLHNRTGRPLGSDEFVEKLERIVGRILKTQKPGAIGGLSVTLTELPQSEMCQARRNPVLNLAVRG